MESPNRISIKEEPGRISDLNEDKSLLNEMDFEHLERREASPPQEDLLQYLNLVSKCLEQGVK